MEKGNEDVWGSEIWVCEFEGLLKKMMGWEGWGGGGGLESSYKTKGLIT